MKQTKLMKAGKTKEQKNPLEGINNYTLYFLQLLAFEKGQNRLESAPPSKKHCNENSVILFYFLFFKGLLFGWDITVNLSCQDLVEHTFDCQLWTVCVCVFVRDRDIRHKWDPSHLVYLYFTFRVICLIYV